MASDAAVSAIPDRAPAALISLAAIREAAVAHALSAGRGDPKSDRILMAHAARALARMERDPADSRRQAVYGVFAEAMKVRMAYLEAVDARTGGTHAGDAYARRFEKVLAKERGALARKAKGAADV